MTQTKDGEFKQHDKTKFKDKNGKEIRNHDVCKFGEQVGYIEWCDHCDQYEFRIEMAPGVTMDTDLHKIHDHLEITDEYEYI